MRKLTLERMLRIVQDYINKLKKLDVDNVDNTNWNKEIQRAKAIAYLLTVALEIYEKKELEEKLEEMEEKIKIIIPEEIIPEGYGGKK